MRGENAKVIILVLIVEMVKGGRQKEPEQIHLSLGESSGEILVTWITFSRIENPFVWYGTLARGLTFRAEGTSKKFTDRGKFRTVRYVHRVVLRNLEPRTFYVYRCGSFFGLSEPFAFKTISEETDWSPKLIVFGDMGWEGAVAFPYILKEAEGYDVDAVVHVGDIAYNMESCEGFVGDAFLQMIQPLASCVPYMTIVGNHEQAQYVFTTPLYDAFENWNEWAINRSPHRFGMSRCFDHHTGDRNFSHYKNKFSMPGNSEGLYYSFDMGPAHFVAISTEVYYFPEYGREPFLNQFTWLKNDLKEASEANNRVLRPWIIVFGHRPMYCSSDSGEDCSMDSNILKNCFLGSCNYGLENLLRENRVDLTFSGHMHYYERSWPIYDNEVYNGSFKEPYRNPGASVHIITGAAGMKNGTERSSFVRRDFFPFFSEEYSYTVLTICNKTHLRLEQVSASRGGEVIDSIWLIKDEIFAGST